MPQNICARIEWDDESETIVHLPQTRNMITPITTMTILSVPSSGPIVSLDRSPLPALPPITLWAKASTTPDIPSHLQV
ncbi:hypothetical protein GYMLUDRAFT_253357 [Collybiopsis luxurians FD-317 M1]|uniref:Unplaced genomic scaffold GYMLUscaffold_194, whole genome shotgun sequence n=1 Tax=Collybiopsis luxurians FD-317 M1 TaxID=944289 RepID=A0A0D0C5N1_9AGAR|nr:hypothetical protein GYMLUDRAFT_253357 [Collybiopsis luxurians FD-317 M1]